jgi:hypothetical protein
MPPGARAYRLASNDAVGRLSGLRVSRSVRNTLSLSPTAQPADPHADVVRASLADTAVESLIRARPPGRSEPTDQKEVGTRESGMRPSEPDSRAGAKPGKGTAAAPCTLHIDGSALGRWAIQHLERTLARPATGMTGVDPRASLPRSRVSPF